MSGFVRVTITVGQLVECGSIYEIKATHLDIREPVHTHTHIPPDRLVKSATFFPRLAWYFPVSSISQD